MSRETKAAKIIREIEELRSELREIQSKCDHKQKLWKYGANTGNYDPSADLTDFFCATCRKRWTESDTSYGPGTAEENRIRENLMKRPDIPVEFKVGSKGVPSLLMISDHRAP